MTNKKVYGGLNSWLEYNRRTTQQRHEVKQPPPRFRKLDPYTDIVHWDPPKTYGGMYAE